MGKHYTFSKNHLYKCDGGINPPHHYPLNVSITENEDGSCRIWTGSTSHQKTYDSLDTAIKKLYDLYDRVTFNGYQIITNYKPSEPIIKKWNQTNY